MQNSPVSLLRHLNAMTCCRFSSFKTLLMPTKGTLPYVVFNVLESYSRWPF
jgi:hypothetical protein